MVSFGRSRPLLARSRNRMKLACGRLPEVVMKLTIKRMAGRLAPCGRSLAFFLWNSLCQLTAPFQVLLTCLMYRSCNWTIWVFKPQTIPSPPGPPLKKLGDYLPNFCKLTFILKGFYLSSGRGRVMVWAPDNNERLTRVANARQEICKDTGVKVRWLVVVPVRFAPLPGCRAAESISDLWGHLLLQNKWDNIVKNVLFLAEVSRCVFTRDTSPHLTFKHLPYHSLVSETDSRVSIACALPSSSTSGR